MFVAGIREKIIEGNKIFDGEFTAEYTEMELSVQDTTDKNKGGKKSRKSVKRKLPIIYCHDAHTFLKTLLELRDFANLNNMFIKVCIDDGPGFLKISVQSSPVQPG